MVDETEELNAATDEKGMTGQTADPEVDSKYRMIILAAQRSKQLQRGAVPRIDADLRKNKPTRVAMKELKEGKVKFDVLEN